MDAFLANQTVPTAPAASSQFRGLAASSATVVKQRISIVGVGYVHMTDSLGNDNTMLSEMAAKAIPNVSMSYGGTDPWVDILADSSVNLTILQAAGDPPLEISVLQLAADGSALSLRRYNFDPASHMWKGQIQAATTPAASDPVISVDTNNNGTYETNEQIVPTNTSGSGTPDTQAPALSMTLSSSGDFVQVILAATDDVTPSPQIEYTINDGSIQTYSVPLSVGAGQNVTLKVFAEDAMGNTTGLITTAVRPTLTSQSNTNQTLHLEWPISEAYVLEEADSPEGPWSESAAQVSRSLYQESAEVFTGPAPRKFFRLRSRSVTR